MTEKENEHTAPSRLFGGGSHPAPLHRLFFPAAVLYHELLLRAFDAQSVFFDGALALILLFAVGTGLFWSLIVNLLRRPRAAFIVSVPLPPCGRCWSAWSTAAAAISNPTSFCASSVT